MFPLVEHELKDGSIRFFKGEPEVIGVGFGDPLVELVAEGIGSGQEPFQWVEVSATGPLAGMGPIFFLQGIGEPAVHKGVKVCEVLGRLRDPQRISEVEASPGGAQEGMRLKVSTEPRIEVLQRMTGIQRKPVIGERVSTKMVRHG